MDHEGNIVISYNTPGVLAGYVSTQGEDEATVMFRYGAYPTETIRGA